MNTTAIFSSDHSWSRRCSTETILSIQGQETDFVRDTSDTEAWSDGEYEPVTEPEDDAPIDTDTSAESDKDIITTKVIEVSVGDEGDLVFADSERTDNEQSDSDVDLFDYWNCAQCAIANDNPTYRYCRKCFQVRKSFFPPRPRRKHKRAAPTRGEKRSRGIDPDPDTNVPLSQDPAYPRTSSQDSGIDFNSQGTSQDYDNVRQTLKRRADSVDMTSKRCKYSDASDSEHEVAPLSKTLSDPSITIDNPVKVTKKVIADTLREIETKDLCVVCVSEPKSGVFVHGRLAHICCCYKCAVKVWAKTKRCPICNCKISNVLKAVVT